MYLSGLAASLRLNRRLRIVEIDARLDKAANELKMLRPEVVVGEIAGLETVEVLRAENPRLMVIVIEAATDSLAVLAGRPSSTSAVTELARVITEYADGQHGQDRDDSSYQKEEYDER